jgi:hypothetical protein
MAQGKLPLTPVPPVVRVTVMGFAVGQATWAIKVELYKKRIVRSGIWDFLMGNRCGFKND